MVCVLGCRTAVNIAQWTVSLECNWSRWIWCCIQSKACTTWHCCLQRTQCRDTWQSVF